MTFLILYILLALIVIDLFEVQCLWGYVIKWISLIKAKLRQL